MHPRSDNKSKATDNEKLTLLDSFHKRKYYKANKKAKSLIEKYPGDPFAYKNLSLVYNAVGKNKEALLLLQENYRVRSNGCRSIYAARTNFI